MTFTYSIFAIYWLGLSFWEGEICINIYRFLRERHARKTLYSIWRIQKNLNRYGWLHCCFHPAAPWALCVVSFIYKTTRCQKVLVPKAVKTLHLKKGDIFIYSSTVLFETPLPKFRVKFICSLEAKRRKELLPASANWNNMLRCWTWYCSPGLFSHGTKGAYGSNDYCKTQMIYCRVLHWKNCKKGRLKTNKRKQAMQSRHLSASASSLASKLSLDSVVPGHQHQ